MQLEGLALKTGYCEICGVEQNLDEVLKVKNFILCKICVLEIQNALIGKILK